MRFETMAASDDTARECWSWVFKQGYRRALAVRKLPGICLQTLSFDDIEFIRIKFFMLKPLEHQSCLVIKSHKTLIGAYILHH